MAQQRANEEGERFIGHSKGKITKKKGNTTQEIKEEYTYTKPPYKLCLPFLCAPQH